MVRWCSFSTLSRSRGDATVVELLTFEAIIVESSSTDIAVQYDINKTTTSHDRYVYIRINYDITDNTSTNKLEAIQRWSATCRVWPWTLTYQKFLLCISSQGQDLYSHQKFNMYIVHLLVLIWERLQTPPPPTTTAITTPKTPDATVQPLGRHIANKVCITFNYNSKYQNFIHKF